MRLGAVTEVGLKIAMDMPYARDSAKLVYVKRLEKLYHGLQSRHLPGMGLRYGTYATPCDHLQVLSHLKPWRATIKIGYKIWSDKRGPFFLDWHSREFNAVPKEEDSRLYVGVPDGRSDYELYRALKMPTSPVCAYLGRKFVDGGESSWPVIRSTCITCLTRIIVLWCC